METVPPTTGETAGRQPTTSIPSPGEIPRFPTPTPDELADAFARSMLADPDPHKALAAMALEVVKAYAPTITELRRLEGELAKWKRAHKLMVESWEVQASRRKDAEALLAEVERLAQRLGKDEPEVRHFGVDVSGSQP